MNLTNYLLRYLPNNKFYWWLHVNFQYGGHCKERAKQIASLEMFRGICAMTCSSATQRQLVAKQKVTLQRDFLPPPGARTARAAWISGVKKSRWPVTFCLLTIWSCPENLRGACCTGHCSCRTSTMCLSFVRRRSSRNTHTQSWN